MMNQNSLVNDQLVGIKDSSSNTTLDVSSAAKKDGTNESKDGSVATPRKEAATDGAKEGVAVEPELNIIDMDKLVNLKELQIQVDIYSIYVGLVTRIPLSIPHYIIRRDQHRGIKGTPDF